MAAKLVAIILTPINQTIHLSIQNYMLVKPHGLKFCPSRFKRTAGLLYTNYPRTTCLTFLVPYWVEQKLHFQSNSKILSIKATHKRQ